MHERVWFFVWESVSQRQESNKRYCSRISKDKWQSFGLPARCVNKKQPNWNVGMDQNDQSWSMTWWKWYLKVLRPSTWTEESYNCESTIDFESVDQPTIHLKGGDLHPNALRPFGFHVGRWSSHAGLGHVILKHLSHWIWQESSEKQADWKDV